MNIEQHRAARRVVRAPSAPFTVLVAPSGFHESLGAEAAAASIAEGVRRAMPGARVLQAPMADGREGFTQALVRATGGTLHEVPVTGPLGQPVQALLGLLGGHGPRTAVLEMAAAAGLRRAMRDRHNPLVTTSRGVGELIRAALDAGAERVLLGCSDSGIDDGGAGMVQALGARLLDGNGRELGAGGGELTRLARIDVSGLDPRLARVSLDAAVNRHDVLPGASGVARGFGPREGATADQVQVLEAALETWAHAIEQATGRAMGEAPGGGASGGLAAGFAGLLGGTLHPRFEIVLRCLELDSLIEQADLVITAEGSPDGATPFDTVTAAVAQRAKRRGVPVIALAGPTGSGLGPGIATRPCTLGEATADAAAPLRRATEEALRIVLVGMGLRPSPSGAGA